MCYSYDQMVLFLVAELSENYITCITLICHPQHLEYDTGGCQKVIARKKSMCCVVMAVQFKTYMHNTTYIIMNMFMMYGEGCLVSVATFILAV